LLTGPTGAGVFTGLAGAGRGADVEADEVTEASLACPTLCADLLTSGADRGAFAD
jgi:hypothetical protein